MKKLYTIITLVVMQIFSQNAFAIDDEKVDLGLPSGLLWATCNIGASSPQEIGAYFSWGETTPKTSFGWGNYKWCDGDISQITKYIDTKAVLDSEDDAASILWGDKWHMPTLCEFQELLDYCVWTYESQNDIVGYSIVGPNGNKLFLPATGHYFATSNNIVDEELKDKGYISYWTCERNLFGTANISCAYEFRNLDDKETFDFHDAQRANGLAIRPVYGERLFVIETNPEPTPTSLLGDVNDDGKIDELDLQELKNYLLHRPTSTTINLFAANVNNDDYVNVLDLQALQNMLNEDEEGEKLPTEPEDDWVIGANKK